MLRKLTPASLALVMTLLMVPGQAQEAPPTMPQTPAAQASEWPSEPLPYLAFGLSAVVPGSGQVVAGDWLRGLAIFAGLAAGLAGRIWLDGHLKTNPSEPLRALETGLTIALPTVWIWQAGDAYFQALPPELRPTPSPSPSPSPRP